MNLKEQIKEIVGKKFGEFQDLNDKIWEFAETKFEEYQSSKLQREILTKEGFLVKTDIANMSTAFIGEYGSGSPVIAILGEFDALPELSQQQDCYEKCSITEGGSGHGCGHNTLGSASLLGAVAVKDYMKNNQGVGTIRYYGCPAEESGAGKTFMARDGVFQDVDIAITWHPHYYTSTMKNGSLANMRVLYKFKGTSSHAAASPHLGRSALDAMELMSVGVNYLREHIIPEARVHYAIINGGGSAPNVVQKETEVLYAIRAPKIQQAKEILERVNKIALGAAMMTETESMHRIVSGYSNFMNNKTISKVLIKNLEQSLPVVYTEEEKKYGQKFKDTVDQEALSSFINSLSEGEEALERNYEKEMIESPIAFGLYPATQMIGSTDVGDVSWNVPTSQFFATCYALGTPSHSWQIVAQGKSSIAHKGMALAAKVLAMTAIDFMENTELVQAAKEDLQTMKKGQSYECPIGKDVKVGNW